MPEKFRAWDDYFIPGTTVLKNKLGETDPVRLSAAEEAIAAIRLDELAAHPIDGAFDYDHMKAIHRHIFQDVYEWAGQERVGPDSFMTKEGHAYYPGPQIAADAEKQYEKLADADLLRGLLQEKFVEELAEYWGELNVIHSFREGNTRTQFVFFSQLAEQAGYVIDTKPFAVGQALRDEFVQARFHSQDTGSNTRLQDVLGRVITPAVPQLSAEQQEIQNLRVAMFPLPAAEAVRHRPVAPEASPTQGLSISVERSPEAEM
ncbi:Fic/DOC family protein [Plantibacter sp. CFBP 13570]|uniref:Fic/DOC family protein n=1 Tax=Plantibacter sp. CFBP 13570 TaxID=2775272 RepID=UPI001930D784|nr:Fic family protein [Plantibacter sp. CFBP 13570]MBD8535682.1 Fic family protein [Plantibacter sp. CFBP 13570]